MTYIRHEDFQLNAALKQGLQVNSSDICIRTFASLELLHEAVAITFNRFIPSPQLGSAESLMQFVKWRNSYSDVQARANGVILIPPDPTSFLVFPTLRQEIDISRQRDDQRYQTASASQIAEEYGFSAKQLDQPLYTFSGGERVRAALLKANLLLPRAKRFVLCSPTQWLHLESYSYLERVAEQAKSLRVPVTLFSLQGDLWPATENDAHTDISQSLPNTETTWFLEATNFDLPLETRSNPSNQTDLVFRFEFEGIHNQQLKSPTLLIGMNGAGKSLLAQCLAGIIGEVRNIQPKAKHGAGPGRVILQDALSHLFRERIRQHVVRVFDFDTEGMKRVNILFGELSSKCREALWTKSPDDPYLVGRDEEPSTLLQAKLMLVAERLVHAPTLLLLDEPAWGLSIRQAKAFIYVVVSYCHSSQIPVLIICHTKDWLPTPNGDQLTVTRIGTTINVARAKV